jgi:hypothetical protein
MESTEGDALLARLGTLVVKSGVALGGLSETERGIALAVAARALPADTAASEAEVNAALLAWLDGPGAFLSTDHVELRRWLVDTGWWRRDGFGRRYERTPDAELPPSLRTVGSALAGIDPAAWIVERRDAERRRREQRRSAWDRRPVPPDAR